MDETSDRPRSAPIACERIASKQHRVRPLAAAIQNTVDSKSRVTSFELTSIGAKPKSLKSRRKKTTGVARATTP
jgi:hypothetical protein